MKVTVLNYVIVSGHVEKAEGSTNNISRKTGKKKN
jgi:hypothetical protein